MHGLFSSFGFSDSNGSFPGFSEKKACIFSQYLLQWSLLVRQAGAKRLLLSARPDLFSGIFSGSTVTNNPKYTVPHRLRLHRMAEVLVTMMQARVPSFPWEKSAVFQSEPPPAGFCARPPAYY